MYKGVEIKNFSSSWNDGLAFCALMHSFLPTRIDYEQMRNESNPKKNFQVAFKVAQSVGIQQTLDIQELLNQERPDWNAVMNYVTLIYKHFHFQSIKDTDEVTTTIKCTRSASSSPNDTRTTSLMKTASSVMTLPLSVLAINNNTNSSSGGSNSAESSNSASSSSSSISKTVC